MKHFFMTALLAAGLTLSASTAWAQRGGGGHGGGHGGGGHAMRSGGSRGFGGARATVRASRSGPAVGNAVPRGSVLPGRGYRPNHGNSGYGVYGPAFGLGLGFAYYDPFWSDWGYAYGPGSGPRIRLRQSVTGPAGRCDGQVAHRGHAGHG